ncbi:hypothetical protein J5N97_006822 [Dioscorea zingiberensis]|uniref:RWP-RK domain-containing protein n=1 Tax=Dioscorea zingiberensis TaxID=325984 RepID=A0A9D5DAX2_9LILI|nr:hypothetical protein J5N97_006822 [Dioscorea zingiberensis]
MDEFDIINCEPFDPSFTPPIQLPSISDEILELFQLPDPVQGSEPPLPELGNDIQCHMNGGEGGIVHEDQNNNFASLVSSVQLDCSACHVLREVVHTNGEKSMKLAIHGGIGVFYHAVIDVYLNTNGLSMAMEKSFFDFSTQTYDGVKRFLVEYGQLRVLDRYIIMQDSLSSFFDALCVRMSYDQCDAIPRSEPQMPEPGLCQSRPAEINVTRNPIQNPRSRISVQRERTGMLQLTDLAEYFHLPIAEASKELSLCTTAIKKICRKYGMRRWPYRKVKSIDKMISNLLNKTGPEDTQNLAEIEKLRERRAQICAGNI